MGLNRKVKKEIARYKDKIIKKCNKITVMLVRNVQWGHKEKSEVRRLDVYIQTGNWDGGATFVEWRKIDSRKTLSVLRRQERTGEKGWEWTRTVKW